MDDHPRPPASPQDTWTAQDAQTRLGEVLEAALAGKTQRVVRPSGESVVVVSEAEWQQRRPPEQDRTFGEFLMTFPLTVEEWKEVAPERHRRRKNPFDEV